MLGVNYTKDGIFGKIISALTVKECMISKAGINKKDRWNKGSFVLELQPKSMVAVIRNGQFSNSLPKCATATTTAQRNLKNLCMLYIELVNCYNEGKIGKLEELVLTMFEDEISTWSYRLQCYWSD